MYQELSTWFYSKTILFSNSIQHPSIHPSNHPTIQPSIHLSIHPSIHFPFSKSPLSNVVMTDSDQRVTGEWWLLAFKAESFVIPKHYETNPTTLLPFIMTEAYLSSSNSPSVCVCVHGDSGPLSCPVMGEAWNMFPLLRRTNVAFIMIKPLCLCTAINHDPPGIHWPGIHWLVSSQQHNTNPICSVSVSLCTLAHCWSHLLHQTLDIQRWKLDFWKGKIDLSKLFFA